MRLSLRHFVFIVGILGTHWGFSSKSFSQPNDNSLGVNEGWLDVTVGTGPFLQTNLPGVTEILPFAGIKFSFPVENLRPEFSVSHGRGDGAIYYLSQFSFRGYFESLFTKDIRPLWAIGLHVADYQRAQQNNTSFEFVKSVGWHFGFGVQIPITDSFSFRNDFYFGIRPGRFLYLDLGFMYTFGSEGETQN